jgi:hypothetical protein
MEEEKLVLLVKFYYYGWGARVVQGRSAATVPVGFDLIKSNRDFNCPTAVKETDKLARKFEAAQLHTSHLG